PARALPLRLTALPEPERPEGFERLKVRLSGICGSDLALLYGKNSPSLSPMFSFPAVLGHEILAELGGVRVVVNPVLSCLERGLPDCPAC
ncbi:alcohol dehydrogenase catalytic domain-containing protein, partial [Escherichia coli]|nr:alcohol dehydrogenase catalytic domain-containing protein [Escherichia coli]